MDYKHLFEPYTLRGVTLKNRLISAPCERNYANTDGSVTQRYIDYVEERAKGGVGLINIESIYVDPVGRGHIRQLGIHNDRMIPGLKRMVGAAHKHGAMIVAHLYSAGREASSYITGRQPIAPSSVPCKTLAGGDMPRSLTLVEIQDQIEMYGEAAHRAVEAGFDVMMIHGAHGYMVGQFLSLFSNKRSDQYGGSFENRMRFPLEVLAKIRSVVGDKVPIAYRMSGEEKLEGGLAIEDSVRFSIALEQAGIDLIDVSSGIYESVGWIAQSMAFPRGCLVEDGWKIKQNVKIPVSIVGRINHPDLAEEILAAGKADFISLGRALHADPYWPMKALEGRVDDIRICPACMSCSDQLATNLPITCAINPEAGRESELRIKPAPKTKKVLVVGAGPAGMEAARVASLRGHKVILCEKSDQMGGQINYASRPHHKKEFLGIINYLEGQLRKSDVEIRMGTAVTTDLIKRINPDAVIIATGAEPAVPFTPGADKKHVCTAIDVLSGKTILRKGPTVLIGAGLVGMETALFLEEEGITPIIIIEPTDKLGGNIGLRTGLFARNSVNSSPNIEVKLKTTVEEIKDDSIIIQKEGRYDELPVKNIVLAAGMRNNNDLAEELKAAGFAAELYMVGDCNFPRTIKEATEEGAIAAHKI
jgi:2,4-dienoyl-CoA reductase-like NADH-dependent reductase (Old Yellow Enzyme family)/thioredoxin reductase